MKFHIKISSSSYNKEKVKDIDERYDKIIRELSYVRKEGIIDEDCYLDLMDSLYTMRETERKARSKGK